MRDRKNPYAPSATDGKDGSYERPPGKFALTDALGSSGKSAVAPKAKPAAAGGDKPENPDDQTTPENEAPDVETKKVKEAAPAPQAAAPVQEAPPVSSAPAQKLPRLDLGRRSGKP